MTTINRPDQNMPADTVVSGLVETGINSPVRVGLTIAFLVFGVFGLWAAIAPISGAAHGSGIVTVKSYKKIVQHLEGGIVSEVYVQNGDQVVTGQALLTLDNTHPLAQLEITSAQFVALKALESRLLAERDGIDTVAYPAILTSGEFNAAVEMDSQGRIFHARKSSREGSVDVLEQRVEQLRSRLVGLHALQSSKELLAASFAAELEDVKALLEQGFSDNIRLRSVERNYAQVAGEAAELTASISATEIQIGETQLQVLQLEKEFLTEVVNQLSEVQTNLKDSNERMAALQNVLNRTIVRAPGDGIVLGMQIHTQGAVIAPGSPIAEIVPQAEELIVEAGISPVDIDRVYEGQEATIRFSSFTSVVPSILGRVIGLSADSLVDRNTGATYYLARIEVTPEGMAELGNLVLVPGMPAEVFITTGSRTLLQYVFRNWSNAIARSFKED